MDALLQWFDPSADLFRGPRLYPQLCSGVYLEGLTADSDETRTVTNSSQPQLRTSMLITDLPQELIDAIIEQLSDERNALAACSLTCRAFLEQSRKNYFYAFTFGDGMDMEPGVANYIRNLTVIRLSTKELSWSTVALCTGIKQLSIQWITLDPTTLKAITTFLPVSEIDKLELENCTFPPNVTMADFICSFSQLNSLRVDLVQWPMELMKDRGNRASPPLSDDLYLRTRKPAFFIAFILQFNPGIRFKTITVNAVCMIVSLNMLIRKCGSSLQRLDLELTSRLDGEWLFVIYMHMLMIHT